MVSCVEVDFYGDKLAPVKINDNVYVGINLICNVLKLNAKKQRNKIQNHSTLKQGLIKLPIKTPGGVQQSLGINIQFLPLWLATINPEKIKYKDTKDKLIKYQLEAKDVLYKVFFKKNSYTEIPVNYIEALKAYTKELENNKQLLLENKEVKEKYDSFINTNGLKTFNEVAKLINKPKVIGRTRLMRFLRENRILTADNLPYQRYLNYFNVKEVISKDNKKSVTCTLVTKKGVDFIYKLLKTYNII